MGRLGLLLVEVVKVAVVGPSSSGQAASRQRSLPQLRNSKRNLESMLRVNCTSIYISNSRSSNSSSMRTGQRYPINQTITIWS